MKISHNSVKGVISAFIALMLTSVLSLGTLVIEAGRLQASKTQLSDANISASTSMIAAYDAVLYDRYGLLAIDTETFTPERCREYLDYNADLSSDLFGNNLTRMYSISSVELNGMYNLTYPSVLKRQILSRAKYHVVPQDYVLNYYNMDSFLIDLQNKCTYVANCLATVANGSAGGSAADISPDMQTALTALYNTYKDLKKHDDSCNITLSGSSVALLPSTTGTVESNIPSEDIDYINDTLSNASLVLGGDASKLSSVGKSFSQTDTHIDVSFIQNMTNDIKDVASAGNVNSVSKQYAKNCRALAQGINASLNLLSDDYEGNMLLNSYISEFFCNRTRGVEGYVGPGKSGSGSGNNTNFAEACLEYVFGGNKSEIINQDKAYDYALAIRLINNLFAVFQNSASFNSNSSYSVLAHIAWGYYESVTDMELLALHNAKVPLGKYNLILNPNNCASVSSAFSTASLVDAMVAFGIYNGEEFIVEGSDDCTYGDVLAIALWFIPNSTKMMRVADLIQLEMRYEQQYVEHSSPDFLMSNMNTFCRVKCVATLNNILPVISSGSGKGMRGISFKSIKYAGF